MYLEKIDKSIMAGVETSRECIFQRQSRSLKKLIRSSRPPPMLDGTRTIVNLCSKDLDSYTISLSKGLNFAWAWVAFKEIVCSIELGICDLYLSEMEEILFY